MDGGTLVVQIATGLDIGLRGPVEEIADGRLTEAYMERLRRLPA